MNNFVFNSRRSPVLGRNGMAATSQPLAVAAGLELLRQGGNAADAAIGMAAALNVTEPTSTGIGGDCFVLYYEKRTRQVTALNGSGRLPAALSLERLQNEGFGQELPPYHPYTITVPGACAAWCDLAERYGRLSMPDVLAPAIHLADAGFPVAPVTAHFWEGGAKRQLAHAPGGRELTVDGRSPRPGEIFQNPGLARTLQRVAEGGKGSFYQGAIADSIVDVIQAAGGCMSAEDLASHESTWETPISTTYRGLRIWECPPNGQGLAALIGLNILEGFELAALPPHSPERLHLEIEAMRLAFADTRWYVADPAFHPAPLDWLLSKEYAAECRRLIDPGKANLDLQHGTPTSASDTVYLSVVDGDGNACSLINSNYMGFGTGIVPAGWGFSLQNRGHNFSLDASHPNALAPRKRPYHTIIPGMITLPSAPNSASTPEVDDTRPNLTDRNHGDELYASFGVMGGFMQPQGHLQVVIALADDKLDPQAALDGPRFCIQNGEARGSVALEEGIPPHTADALVMLGHPIESVSGYSRAIFGRGQIILRDPANAVLWGGSDPRADGCVMSL